MPRFWHTLFVSSVALLVGTNTHALDLVAGGGLNYKRLDMSFAQDIQAGPAPGGSPRLAGDITQDIAFDAWQPFLQGSLAAIRDDWYGVFNAELAVLDEGTEVDVSQTRTPADLAINVARSYTDTDVDVGRHDLGLTLGWRGIEATALFAGFKYGNTEFDGKGVKRQFIADGPFVGASYSWPLAHSVLTLGGAWAWMSGEYDESGSGPLLARRGDGDASGLSAFVSWSAPWSERLRYALDLRWQRYTFDGHKADVCNDCASPAVDRQPVLLDRDLRVRETLYSLGIGLTYAL